MGGARGGSARAATSRARLPGGVGQDGRHEQPARSRPGRGRHRRPCGARDRHQRRRAGGRRDARRDGCRAARAEPQQRPDEDRGRPTNPADLVEQPAKVMRIGSMVKQLLEEVRSAPLDEQGRARLAEIHERSIAELKDGLAPELVDELERIALPFKEEAPVRRRAPDRPGPARRVARRAVPRHPDRAGRPADGRAGPAAADAPAAARRQPPARAGGGGSGMPHPQRPPGEPGHTEGTGQYL